MAQAIALPFSFHEAIISDEDMVRLRGAFIDALRADPHDPWHLAGRLPDNDDALKAGSTYNIDGEFDMDALIRAILAVQLST